MLVGCLGWICSAILQSVHHFWCGARHGDGPVHNRLSTGIPQLRVAAVGDPVPEPDFSGSRQSLYAHVRHA